MIYQSNSLKDTKNIAEKIANNINIGNIITLSGNLGTGKTSFASFIINFFLKKNNLKTKNVISPTFSILKEYPLKNFSIFHFDLYRIKNINELYELDIENILEKNISIIEWPEIAKNILYNIKYQISIKIENNTRIIKIINN